MIVHPVRREKGRTNSELHQEENFDDIQDEQGKEQDQVEIVDDQKDEEYQPELAEKSKISNKRKNTESPSPRRNNKSVRMTPNKKTPKKITPGRKTPAKKKAKPRSESSDDEEILPRSSLNLLDVRPPGSPAARNPSKDLLERYLEDQMNVQAQADTEDLIDGLNNIGREEPVAAVSPTKQRLRH